jgi:hypothetical protein
MTGEFGLSGSIGLDDSRMINARLKSSGDEWRIGGSWLFPVGIVNFNFSRSAFDHYAYKNNYCSAPAKLDTSLSDI